MIWTNEERRAWLSEATAGWKGILRAARSTSAGDLLIGSYLRGEMGLGPGNVRVYGRYAIVFIIDGEGTYYDVLGMRRPIGPGDVVLVFPEIGHNYSAAEGGWSEFHIVFDGPVFNLLRSDGLLEPSEPIFHVDDLDGILARFEDMLTDEGSSDLEMVYRFAAFLTEVVSRHSSGNCGKSPQAAWLGLAINEINDRLAGPLDIEALSELVGMTYDGFRKAFRREMGVPVGQYHSQRRITTAKSLLEHTNITVKQIADNLGYVDEYHFSNRFWKQTGMRPGTYRTASKKKPDPTDHWNSENAK
jgi:AraC-like DNA-binding protein